MNNQNQKLYKLVMIWTIITTVFAWLPLIRIIGRPEGYHWGVLGLSGEGFNGPFWIFIPLVLFVLAMMFSAYRTPRKVFYPLLIVWHLLFTGVVTAGILQSGTEATIQGQGLHWEFPLWILVIPCVLFLAAAVLWVVRDVKAGSKMTYTVWSGTNTKKLVAAFILLIAAIILFRLGTNYNWVTAVAIITTVLYWIILVESLQSDKEKTVKTSINNLA